MHYPSKKFITLKKDSIIKWVHSPDPDKHELQLNKKRTN